MKIKLMIFLLIALLSLSYVTSTCTITLNKASYIQGETATASMSCSEAAEKSKAYTLTWTNETGDTEEIDTGTTPSTIGQTFIESFDISADWMPGVWLNATLTGSSLEGEDSANVTAQSATDILLSSSSFQGKYLGLTSSIISTATVGGKELSGGYCRISLWDNDGIQMLDSKETKMVGGEVKEEFILDYESFDEGVDYKLKIICFCGTAASLYECIDEDGTSVEDTIGETIVPFTTNIWLTFNDDQALPAVYENGSDYPQAIVFAGFGEKTFWLINITNSKGTTLHIKGNNFLTNNVTGETFRRQIIEEGGLAIANGTNTHVAVFEVPKESPTGLYFIRSFIDVFFNNILVAQYIQKTETFNVTGTDDSFVLGEVITEKSNYYTGSSVHVCVNVTNKFTERVEFNTFYNIRCSSTGSDFDTERSIVAEHSERRAVNPETSQYQCADLFLDYVDHLVYQTSQCYASVTLQSPYIDTFDNKRLNTSTIFNTTDYGMYPEYELDPTYPLVRLFPDWRRFDDLIDGVSKSYYRAKINITDLQEAFLDPDNEINDTDWDIYAIFSDKMPCSQEMYNYTVLDLSGNIIDNPIEDKALTWKLFKNGRDIESHCSIGIEDVNFSDVQDDYFVVKVWFEDFEERSTLALENISENTGTFKVELDCPSQTDIGSTVRCQLTARLEQAGFAEETGFTCYLEQEGIRYSESTFQRMVSQEGFNITGIHYNPIQNIDFLVPSTLEDNSEITAKCEIIHYDLGGRQETISDTITLDKQNIWDYIVRKIWDWIVGLGAVALLIPLLALCLLFIIIKKRRKEKQDGTE